MSKASVDQLGFQRHSSNLPLVFYLFSFAPPLELRKGLRGFIVHPLVQFFAAFFLSVLAAGAIPAVDLVYGLWTGQITERNVTPAEIMLSSNRAGYIIFSVGVAQLLMTWLSFSLFMLSSETLTNRLRIAYASAVLAQDVDWFDMQGPGEICKRISTDIDAIRIGLGEKMLYVSNGIGVLVGSTALGFIRSPSIAGVLFPIIPVVMAFFALLGRINDRISRPELILEGQIATFMDQILTSLPIVHAFDAIDSLMKKLDNALFRPLIKTSRKRAVIRAIELSSVYAVMMWNYSAFFAWGAHQIAAGNVQIGPATTAFWSFINSFFTIANIVPHLGSIVKAFITLRGLRAVIQHAPRIDGRLDQGIKDVQEAPGFQLEDVTFSYPSRQGVKALRNVSMEIEANKFTAFVGPSGSGKSTVLSLLLREYDPEVKPMDNAQAGNHGDVEKAGAEPSNCGRVLFASQDLRNVNLSWFRSQVAIVPQHLHLFTGSVLDNVAVGLSRQQCEEIEAQPLAAMETKRRVVEALQKAQAWDFVSKLPEGIDTILSGNSFSMLSGGQKQRLALARALVREPKVLFLDEATSALDSATEERIRNALRAEQERRPMTCCVIAHRLSTVRNADKIVVFANGRIVDQGSHTDLMSPSRLDDTYRSLVQRQQDVTEAGRKTTGVQGWDSQSTLHPLDVTLAEKQTGISHVTKERQDATRLESIAEDVSGSGATVVKPVSTKPTRPDAPVPFLRMLRHLWVRTTGQRCMFLIGCLSAVSASAVFPASGYMTGKGVSALAQTDPRSAGYYWALLLFGMGIADAILYTIQGFCLEDASARLSFVLQKDSLRRLAMQSLATVASYDDNGSSMAAAISLHPATIASGTGTVLGNVIISVGNFLGSIVLAFALSWKATLVTFAPITLILAASYLTVIQLQKSEHFFAARSDRCIRAFSEQLIGIRTVFALGRQQETLRVFELNSQLEKHSVRYSVLLAAFGFAVGQSFMLLPSALVFYWTGTLLARGEINLSSIYAVFELQLITGFAASRLTTFVPDIARTMTSVQVVSGWLERPLEKVQDHTQPGDDSEENIGDVEFSEIVFRYPARPQVPALRGVSLKIEQGTTVALVGTSGSGKSSLLGLLSRLYDPDQGSVKLHGVDLRDLDLRKSRGKMALVSQDAVLFQGSIAFNVALGASTREQATSQAIRSACRQADILSFVDHLPAGMDTDVGPRGSNLSGGQRQRLCIARALLRDPEVLLLDEASSALDARSEAVIQAALDKAARGRTTLLIAHRLSTVRKADCIYVVEDGLIIEHGTHAQLLQKNGRYRELVQAQL